ncbi:MAG: hypothetical protein ACD_87C00268G0002 [uncultured bacterium]|nr:MAG: hypothetical protein ACD_87C00268G0002 [uncultured bacterium]
MAVQTPGYQYVIMDVTITRSGLDMELRDLRNISGVMPYRL